jgi:hypothetical protein
MNATGTSTGGYAASGMRTCLEGGFLAGLGEALGHDYLYSVRRYISNKGGCAELNAKIFLPAEAEVYGTRINGDGPGDSATDCQYVNPVQLLIFRDSYKRRIKRCNGSRQWYFLSTAHAADSASFCNVNGNGNAHNDGAVSAGGCAPGSVSHAVHRVFNPAWPAQKEKPSCGATPANIRLDTSGRTLAQTGKTVWAWEFCQMDFPKGKYVLLEPGKILRLPGKDSAKRMRRKPEPPR